MSLLMFFAGPDWAPLDTASGPRIRTLDDGYLPIQNYDVTRDGVRYHFTMFAAPVGNANGPAANFVRVTATNETHETRAAFLATAVRYTSPQEVDATIPNNRFARPVIPAHIGAIWQPGEKFNANWVYSFDNDAFLRDHRVIYLFPENPKPVLGHTLTRRYNLHPISNETKLALQPTTPTGVARYVLSLAPGEHKDLDFKMPVIPMEKGTKEIKELERASFDQYRESIRSFWRKQVARGMSIIVPEEKANNLFRTSLVNDLLSLNHVGDDWIQTVNLTHYHGFWLRDCSDIVHMYDATGYHDEADRILRFYPRFQQPDGNFLSQKGEFDAWGQTLWIYGFHYRITHDKAFAERVYPSVVRAIDWFEKATAADPLGLMPSTDVKDAEFIPGHLTGYNFLALDGIQGAIVLGRALGKTDDVTRFQHDYDMYRKQFLKVLDQRASANGGAIPPALDGDNGGSNWGNLLGVTPEPQLDPHDPKITATLKRTQSHYEEGLILFNLPHQGDYLHHYLTIKNTLTEVTREDQEQAVREYYALMLHTSSTNSGFEYAIRPWGNRDFKGNLAPHGWFAAEFRSLMRAMMIREEADSTLHLLSVVSPEWIGAGKKIVVENAPTMFGTLGFELVSTSDTSAELNLHIDPAATRPQKILMHLPWFMDLESASANGRALRATDGAVEIPLDARSVKITWRRRATAPALSYRQAVDKYRIEYRRHYGEYQRTGAEYVP